MGLLGGCVADPDEKAPTCPNAAFAPGAAIVTRYDGHGTDLTNLVLSGRLVDIKGSCRGVIGGRTLQAKAQPEMTLTRGPAAHGRDVTIGYVVAAVTHGKVLQKQLKMQHVVFPPNVDTVDVTGDETDFLFPTPHLMSGQNYTIYFAFDLTPEELAGNLRSAGQ
jgi:glycerol dehydrogenase-like iron-containing ADH family enzyme